MEKVYLLQHCYEINEIEESKIIGIYSTYEKASEIMERYKNIKRFSQYPNDFYIDEYEINKNHWEEGFIKWEEAK